MGSDFAYNPAEIANSLTKKRKGPDGEIIWDQVFSVADCVIISLALVLLVTASGTLASYVYDEGAAFVARLCAGACIGVAALGLVGFVFSSLLGLTPLAIVLALLVVILLPLAFALDPKRKAIIQQDLRLTYRALHQTYLDPGRLPLAYLAFYAVVAAILWQAFQRAMIVVPEGIFTGVLNNFGDLPFHLSVISGFAYGKNFPPEDPTYAGVRFTYPFLTDFISAIFVRSGADLRQSMFLENFVVALAFVGLLHRWALEILRDKLAAVITPVLVILNGGFGWILLWDQLTKKNENGLVGILANLPPSFTVIPDTTWRWGNAISTLLLPQRGFLLGLPLAVIVFTQWWLSDDKPGKRREAEIKGAQGKRGKGKSKTQKEEKNPKGAQINQAIPPTHRRSSSPFPFPPFPFFPVPLSVRRMIAAGIVAGLLPLVHAHSFVVVMVVGACLALLQQRWREWITFFFVASLIALPQIWWSTHHSAVNSSAFFGYEFGWDSAKETFFNFKLGSQTLATMPRLRATLERLPDVVWFWLKNAGLFIPLTIAALLWRDEKGPLVSRRLLIFFLPFTLCFLIPNVLKLAPWIWDNIKVLFYWWLASAPLVALLLARLWRQGVLKRAIALTLFVCLTLAGALDVAAIVLRSNKYDVFNSDGIKFAELMKQQTPPRAMVIHAPVHNHPVFLTGRRSLMGYPGHVWTHGLEFAPRESEIRRVYAGASDAGAILRKYGVAYVVVSPLERNIMNVNDEFFSKFEIVGEVDGYRLYKVTQP